MLQQQPTPTASGMASIPEDGEMVLHAGMTGTSGKQDGSAAGDEGPIAPGPTPFSSLAHGTVHRNTVVAQPGETLMKAP